MYVRNLVLAAACGLAGYVATAQPFEPIAGYVPGSQVTDHNAIDLDQSALESASSSQTQDAFNMARAVYENGGHSKSFARVTITPGLNDELFKGATIMANGVAVGTALSPFGSGATQIDIQYTTSDNQASYVGCRVGALGGITRDQSGQLFRTTTGCLPATGTLSIGGTTFSYTYNPLTDNMNGRTIQGFSTQAQAKMHDCPIGCPYPDYLKFFNYYGSHTYGDDFVKAAYQGTNTAFTNGNINMGPGGPGNNVAFRNDFAKKATAYMIVYMYVLREFEDALDDCVIDCQTPNCNDDPVHAWDEGVAFYTGSAVGQAVNSVESGFLMYSLNNKRCRNFKTCGPTGNQVGDTDGNPLNANVNIRLFDLFDTGRDQINAGQCQAARITKAKIAELMAVGNVQGTIRYAHIIGQEGIGTPKARGEGAVFAAAVLPIVHACSPQDAQIIYDNMSTGRNPSFAAVKEAFERNYECMGLTCADIGGYFDSANDEYFPGAAPCVDHPLRPIAGYAPGSQVTDHNAIDQDQRVIEAQLKNGRSGFAAARRVYSEGGFSRSYARLSLTSAIPVALVRGASVDGYTSTGTRVRGKTLSAVDAGAMSLPVQYVTINDQDNYVDCTVGALPSEFVNTAGCFNATGVITVAGAGTFGYSYNPRTQNLNSRTIRGFSTTAEARMYRCSNGCPYADFVKFFNYYGSFTYADDFVMAAIDGTSTSFTRGNADFSVGDANDEAFRIDVIKKATAYMVVYMYVIREFEDGVGDCVANCNTCNQDPVHAWDEGVAFWTGSAHGEAADTATPGFLLYALSNKRCENFKTCGPAGDATVGNSKNNMRLFDLFSRGRDQLAAGQCAAATSTTDQVTDHMAVPLIQGVIRYAHITGPEGDRSPKSLGEGAVFAAAVLPLVHACDPGAANTIFTYMRANAQQQNFVAVKEAFESVYSCLNITCGDVGGYYDSTNNRYYDNAAPCTDSVPVVEFTICYSGDNTVQVEGRGTTSIKDLQIGDSVLTDTGYETVYGFGHYEPNVAADYLKISTDALEPIEMSKEHMIFVNRNAKNVAVPASAVVVGDKLVTPGEFATVLAITSVKGFGAYAPFTTSGSIVVNGAVASSFVSLNENEEMFTLGGGVKTPFTWQFMAQLSQAPHRLACKFGFCKEETYVNGISSWVYVPLQYTQYLVEQNILVAAALIAPVIPVVVGAALVEAFLNNMWLMFAGLAAVALFMKKSKRI